MTRISVSIATELITLRCVRTLQVLDNVGIFCVGQIIVTFPYFLDAGRLNVRTFQEFAENVTR